MGVTLPQLLSLLGSLLAGLAVIIVRLKAANRPTSLRKIIAPPLGMATGFLMFVVPDTRIPWLWGLAAFVVGAIFFAYPLIATSKFEVKDGQIFLKRSKIFIVIIVALLAVRVILHDVVDDYVTIPQSAGVFFLLAFGMLLPWRLAMWKGYAEVERRMAMPELESDRSARQA
ncbi:CcdC family protein [Cohnella fermenti]|uniref:Cytochrome c biogenesis protein CcdC n=1 Tax=Cohnella fermenti TaxID=2565925 RepID=A0A4S4C863_9BACL|nr:cytochrome c biogenesis protein CcdC [Cohnella fermenti]THF84117.1 cytochrome c biogenesis protein CcdC [Cohnella fermenti]